MKATAYQERGLSAKLTNAEKMELSLQSREAYRKMKSAGATDESESEFRHRLALQACGRRVSEAVRGDYSALSAAFLAAGGHLKRAFHAVARGETEPRRIAEVKLAGALKKAGLHIGYAEAICLKTFKCGLEQASAKQLWKVFYTITNRGNTKARQAAAQPVMALDTNNPF